MPSVQDWLPVNHLERFVVDIVTRLDLTPLRVKPYSRGDNNAVYEMSDRFWRLDMVGQETATLTNADVIEQNGTQTNTKKRIFWQ